MLTHIISAKPHLSTFIASLGISVNVISWLFLHLNPIVTFFGAICWGVIMYYKAKEARLKSKKEGFQADSEDIKSQIQQEKLDQLKTKHNHGK